MSDESTDSTGRWPGTGLFVGAVLVGMIVCFAMMKLSTFREPVYEGKLLSVWLRAIDTPEGQRVIRAYGTNDLGAIVSFVRRKDSRFKRWLLKWGQKQSFIKVDSLIDTTSPSRYRGNAVSALSILGPKAEGAIPQLVGLLSDKEVANDALRGIFVIGTEAIIVPLSCGLTNKDTGAREWSTYALLNDYKYAREVAGKGPSSLQSEAFLKLQVFRANQERITSALVQNLGDSDPCLRIASARALAEFDSSTKKSLPQLHRLTVDANPNVRIAAKSALNKLAADGTLQIHKEAKE